jgi:hypothetical protein
MVYVPPLMCHESEKIYRMHSATSEVQSWWSGQELGSQIFCVTCARLFATWVKYSRSMSFSIPIIWREPMDHASDWYFCLSSITGVTAKSKHTVQYPNVPSATRPVSHGAELPVPKPPTDVTLIDVESCDEDVGQANKNIYCDSIFARACSSKELHLLTEGGWMISSGIWTCQRSRLNFQAPG